VAHRPGPALATNEGAADLAPATFSLVHAHPAAHTGTRRLGRTDPTVDLPDLTLEMYDDEHDERHIELCDEHGHNG
jgi:hypothetical protein